MNAHVISRIPYPIAHRDTRRKAHDAECRRQKGMSVPGLSIYNIYTDTAKPGVGAGALPCVEGRERRAWHMAIWHTDVRIRRRTSPGDADRRFEGRVGVVIAPSRTEIMACSACGVGAGPRR
jgi:hypothetical protein